MNQPVLTILVVASNNVEGVQHLVVVWLVGNVGVSSLEDQTGDEFRLQAMEWKLAEFPFPTGLAHRADQILETGETTSSVVNFETYSTHTTQYLSRSLISSRAA